MTAGLNMQEVELHNTAPECVAATRRTVEMLGGRLVEKDGRYYVPLGYIAWACQQQGYVKKLLGLAAIEDAPSCEGGGGGC